MDWKSLILDLKHAGVTQQEIGREIGLSQPGVSDLARGRTHEVSWSVGQKLIALHAARCGHEERVGVSHSQARPRPLPASGQGVNTASPTAAAVQIGGAINHHEAA